MTRTLLRSFDPPASSHFTSASVDFDVSEIADAGIREVLQTPWGCVWRAFRPGRAVDANPAWAHPVWSCPSGVAAPRRRTPCGRPNGAICSIAAWCGRCAMNLRPRRGRNSTRRSTERRWNTATQSGSAISDLDQRSGQGGRAARNRSGCTCQQSRVSDRRRAAAEGCVRRGLADCRAA